MFFDPEYDEWLAGQFWGNESPRTPIGFRGLLVSLQVVACRRGDLNPHDP